MFNHFGFTARRRRAVLRPCLADRIAKRFGYVKIDDEIDHFSSLIFHLRNERLFASTYLNAYRIDDKIQDAGLEVDRLTMLKKR